MQLFANNGHATFNRTGLGTEKVLFEKRAIPSLFLGWAIGRKTRYYLDRGIRTGNSNVVSDHSATSATTTTIALVDKNYSSKSMRRSFQVRSLTSIAATCNLTRLACLFIRRVTLSTRELMVCSRRRN